MNEHIQAAKRKMEPAWNELRERRVLEQVLDKSRQPQTETPRRRGLWLGLGSAAAAGVAAALWIGLAAASDEPLNVSLERSAVRGGYATANGTQARSLRRVGTPRDAKVPSVVRFSEGSVATVSPGGELTVTLQQPRRIELLQHSGQVRYRVKPGQARSFQVTAAGVTVLVIGTEFTVAIEPGERVLIQVTKGVVEARDSQRRVRLRAGEKVLLRGMEQQPQPQPLGANVKGSLAPPMTTAQVTTDPPPHRTRPAPPMARVRRADVATLLRRVDAARRTGQLSKAAGLLRELIRRPTADPRQHTARFILAQIEFSRRHYAASARAYRDYRRRARRSPLAEDALAGEARARWAAGQHATARKLARLYRKRYPKGPHTRAMRDIIQ